MASIGRTTWPIFTPGSTSIVQGFGNCLSATRRTLRAACSTARRKSGLTCLRAARISPSAIHKLSRRRSMSSKFLHPSRECRISAPANIVDNLRRDAFSFGVMLLARTQEFFLDGRGKSHDAHHSTILFKGFDNPLGLAAFSFGRICRTTASLDDGIYSDPIRVTQSGNRRLLQRG